jgi:UDP-N-acetylmuramoylalanine--D-glutamate ligase
MIPLTPYADRRIAVLGLGKSGMATVRAAREGGAEVVAWDDSAERRAELPAGTIRDLTALDWRSDDLLVPAPGIPLTHPAPHPAIAAARAAGVMVTGDIDMFQACCPDSTCIGVTGTNGKSTTTALIAHVLTACGRKANAAGNIGQAVLDLAPPAGDIVQVLELSSYQLDLTHTFHPRVGVFLNLTPDHLDRHGDMAGYMAAKERLFANMATGDTAVVGIDDRPGRELAGKLAARGLQVVPVSVGDPLAQGVYVLNSQLYENGLSVCDLSAAKGLPGTHNHQNAAVAWAACRALGCKPADLARGILSFPGLAHRIERIGSVGGVSFYNDSKATNGEAAAKALGAFRDIYWIAGGKPKDGGLQAALPFIGNVRRTYLIGEASEGFASELEGRSDTENCGTLANAVEAAWRDASLAGNGTILLSPACASFDQFPNFEARGQAFRAAAEYILARQGGVS